VQTTIQEYREFLKDLFKKLKLRVPIFYNCEFEHGFDLQVAETNTEKYF
jgi:thymidylate synthase ThyX